MVKNLKHYAKQPINNGEITSQMVKNKDILPEDIDLTKPFNFPLLSIGFDSGAGVLISDLTEAFGDPENIVDGTVFIYKDTSNNKVYKIVIFDGTFYIEELTAAEAE